MMTAAETFSRKSLKPAEWFSRRHETREEHDAARATFMMKNARARARAKREGSREIGRMMSCMECDLYDFEHLILGIEHEYIPEGR